MQRHEQQGRATLTRRLGNKRAVITGGAGGIGLAIAERFLAEGASVLIADINAARGAVAANELNVRHPGKAHFQAADVSDVGQVKALVKSCVDRLGGIDVLVNNAGITQPADILEITEAQYDAVLDVNLKAGVFATQFAARQMISQGSSGVVINMSSVNAVLTIPEILAYNLSKGAMNQLTRNSAIALAPHNIRVCGIGPGTIMTELARATAASDESRVKVILSRTPMARIGEPEEIASVAAFLASDDASYVTGETVYVDGGRLGLNYVVDHQPRPSDAAG